MTEAKYKLPSVTVDVVVFTIDRGRLQLLLIQRKKDPFKDHWALPGGFLDVDNDKNLKESALRELKEETGIVPPHLVQLGAWGDIDRDPRGRVITIAYYTVVNRSVKHSCHADDDASNLMWFNVFFNERTGVMLRYKKKPVFLAFDHHSIITSALKALRRDIFYIPIASPLLNPTFSAAELAEIYEILLNQSINARELVIKLKSQGLIANATQRLLYFTREGFELLEKQYCR